MKKEDVIRVREEMKLSRRELARSLAIAPETLKKWEESDDRPPTGLAGEVLASFAAAIADGVDPAKLARKIRFGIGAMIYYGLIDDIEFHKTTDLGLSPSGGEG